MTRVSKSLIGILLLLPLGALLMWAFVQGRKEIAMERERERPVQAPSRVSMQHGEPTVTLDPATQTASGLVITSLPPTTHREGLKAYGTVVPVQDLADLRNRIAAARAQVEKARASLEASRKAFERLQALHADNRNISDKALQAAESAWRVDEAGAFAAEETLTVLEGNTRQQWGDTLADWLLKKGSAAFDALTSGRERLVEVTLPSDVAIATPPRTALIQGRDGAFTPAALISSAPTTDPRLQGVSFFYRIPAAKTGLVPGMTVLASLPAGATTQGVVVPPSAAVWWQGQAWVYVQQAPDRFIRREIPTGTPTPIGWFVSRGMAAGDRVVITGAQLLLSEESRSQIHVGEDSK